MNCPVCKTVILSTSELEPELFTLHCASCGGHWIQSYRYWRWRERCGSDRGNPFANESPDSGAQEPQVPKQCPECLHILVPHRVGHGVHFHLDRCGNCGGIWFDASEWETLRAWNLHTDVHKVFNAVWQREVFEAEQAEIREKRLTELLGRDDLDEARRVKRWLDSHPQSGVLYALLTQEQR